MKLTGFDGVYETPKCEALSIMTEQPVLNGSFSNENIGDEIEIMWE